MAIKAIGIAVSPLYTDGVLVTGNSILCGNLFFNQCYRPVRQFHHQRVNDEEGSVEAGKGERRQRYREGDRDSRDKTHAG